MKKSKSTKQAIDIQTPPVQVEEAIPYPLDLVANIAMQMILGGHVPERPGDSGLNLYSNAALLALSLLDDCDKARLQRQARQQRQVDTILHNAETKRKFPDGMLFSKAVRYVTGAASETEALPVFKRWLQERKLADWTSTHQVPATEAAIVKVIENLRKNNFPIFADREGLPAGFTLEVARTDFQKWHLYDYLPSVKQASGKTPKKRK